MTIRYWLPASFPYAMIAIIPGVILVRKGYAPSAQAIRHEQIHHQQQKEMLVVFFYLWYGIEFLVRLVWLRNWHKAYRRISFEREAYNESWRPVSERKKFNWTKYL